VAGGAGQRAVAGQTRALPPRSTAAAGACPAGKRGCRCVSRVCGRVVKGVMVQGSSHGQAGRRVQASRAPGCPPLRAPQGTVAEGTKAAAADAVGLLVGQACDACDSSEAGAQRALAREPTAARCRGPGCGNCARRRSGSLFGVGPINGQTAKRTLSWAWTARPPGGGPGRDGRTSGLAKTAARARGMNETKRTVKGQRPCGEIKLDLEEGRSAARAA
jgi:hypothetical protein